MHYDVFPLSLALRLTAWNTDSAAARLIVISEDSIVVALLMIALRAHPQLRHTAVSRHFLRRSHQLLQ
jgi:hypothetical protein